MPTVKYALSGLLGPCVSGVNHSYLLIILSVAYPLTPVLVTASTYCYFNNMPALVQIIAEYEEHNGPSAPQGGDGTSGSSVGSTSPDVFQSSRRLITPKSATIANKALSSTQGGSQHRSSPVPSAIRSSPAMIYNNDSRKGSGQFAEPPDSSQFGDRMPYKTEANSKQRHYNDPLPPRPNTNGVDVTNSGYGVATPFLPQPERLTPPVLNNTIDKRHSVEVTEKDLSAGQLINSVNYVFFLLFYHLQLLANLVFSKNCILVIRIYDR